METIEFWSVPKKQSIKSADHGHLYHEEFHQVVCAWIVGMLN